MQSNNQKVLAYYFPQYHSIPENDMVFGTGFNDWELFKNNTNIRLKSCKFPIEPPTGLGFYDPRNVDIRIQQASLAKKYGIDGFIYYHYWLENKPVMDAVLNNLLEDNQPDMPFCLCFANQSWKHCYGRDTNFKKFHSDGSTFRQLYDNPNEHAKYLQRLFNHKNYIRINNLPVLFLYIVNSNVLSYLMRLIEELKQYNIDNIYLIANTSWCCLQEYKNAQHERMPDAYSPFIAHGKLDKLPDSLSALPQVYSGYMGWNVIPRHPNSTHIVDFSPDDITKNTCKDLLLMKYDTKSPQIYAIFAWNEWAEGAIIEPNSIYGEDLGNVIKKARDIVEYITTNSEIVNTTIEYGYLDKFIDITRAAYFNCMKNSPSDSDSKWSIYIPKGDINRSILFGDPLIGVHKVVKVSRNGSVAIYDETQDIDIPIL